MKVPPDLQSLSHGKLSAFTLIELMVVLALIAILSAVLLPEMRGSLAEVQLRSSARKLAEACDVAFSRSVATGRTLRLEWDRTAGKYRVIHDPEESRPRTGSGTDVRAEGPVDFPGASGTIDPRITVDLHRLSAGAGNGIGNGNGSDGRRGGMPTGMDSRVATGAAATAIEFRPDGTADASEFVLQDRAGFRLALRLNPITSRIRISELPRL